MANATQTVSTLPTSNFCGDTIHAYLPFTEDRMLMVYGCGRHFYVCDIDANVSNDILCGLYYPVGGQHFQCCDTLDHALHVAATWQTTKEPEYIYPRS